MAETIKGISVKIGADTSDFIKGLKKVDKEINYSEKQVANLQKQLEIKFDETTFKQAQELVIKDIESTEQKAKALKEQLKFLEETGNVDTEGYKKLQLELAKTDTQAMKLNQTLEQLDKTQNANKKTLGSLITSVKNMAANMGTGTAAIVAAGTAAYKLVKETTAAADEISTLATKYNQSTEAIQRWNYIAMQSDVDANTLYKSMKKLNSAFSEQAQGEINNSTKALEKLGINIANFDNNEDAFTATIQRISSLKDVTQQTYYANQIFGEQVSSELIPLFQQGSEAIVGYNKEFEASGALTEDQIKDLSEFDNQMNKVKSQFNNLKYQLGSALLAIIKVVVNLVETSVIPALNGVMDILQPIIDAISWIVDKIGKFNNFAIDVTGKMFGKGWLWGKDVGSSEGSENSSNFNDTFKKYSIPYTPNTSTTYNEDNSSYDIDVSMNTTGNLEYDAEELANEVIRQIAIKQQARS